MLRRSHKTLTLMIRAKIVGAGGYGGIGILELLLRHPEVEVLSLVDVEHVGTRISDLYPHLAGFTDLAVVAATDSAAQEPVDVVFMATPDGVGMALAPEAIEAGSRVVDYSGDFRFNTPEAYADYAQRIGRPTEHRSPDLLPRAVYGLPELHRNEITHDTLVVGNPGCFAVSCILGLAPAVATSLVSSEGLICDCKTGVSGAGKKPAPPFHYPARYDQMNAYKLAGHQHVCEIERELGLLANAPIAITFTSQVVPACRGILSTLYGRLEAPITEADALSAYREFYSESSFIRVFASTAAIGTVHVRGTNFCNLTISVDTRTNTLRVVSHIDNLVKGQAGSALQNMNLLFGLDETTGLQAPGIYP
jgi:N-acetyl-gamma-glutamyl-phosphate reductase